MRRLVTEMFEETSTSREQSFEAAAEDLKAATAPALELLVQSVPGSSTPEEAMSAIEREQASDPVLPPGPTPPPNANPPPEVLEAVIHYRVRHHMTRYRRTDGERLVQTWAGPSPLVPRNDHGRELPPWKPTAAP